jgi:hypothetical protein
MAGNEGSVQRLPNGNTLICTGGGGMGGGSGGRVFEVTSSGTTVWSLTGVSTTKAARYAYSYLGEQYTTVKPSPAYSAKHWIGIAANPINGQVRDCPDGNLREAHLSLLSLDGRELGGQPAGIYLVKITSGSAVAWDKVTTVDDNAMAQSRRHTL